MSNAAMSLMNSGIWYGLRIRYLRKFVQLHEVAYVISIAFRTRLTGYKSNFRLQISNPIPASYGGWAGHFTYCR